MKKIARKTPSSTPSLYREIVRVNQPGQITIPRPIRKHLTIQAGDYLETTVTKSAVLLQPVRIVRRRSSHHRSRTIHKEKPSRKQDTGPASRLGSSR